MDIRASKGREENEAMDWNEIFGQENEEEEDIYCSKFLKIPKYSIVIGKNKNILLSHKCKEKEENKNFPIDKNIFLILLRIVIIAKMKLLICV